MPVTLPPFRIGEALRHEALSVFPLYAEPNGEVDYVLSDEAMAAESVVVEETNEAGSVPDLLVENRGPRRVLFLEGEALIGAKQNRILNTSVLVPAETKLKIPVSCVEQGRWGYRSRQFASGGMHSPSKLRRALKASVTASAKAKRGYLSDQGAVWQEVAALHEAHCTASPTAAMDDTYAGYQNELAEFRDHLKYPERAAGVAVCVGENVVALDVFDRPSTLEHVWDRLLSGYILDALVATESAEQPDAKSVEELLATSRALQWEQTPAVGEGEDFRAESPQGHYASALAYEGTVVHASVMPAP
jgi:hypothetical protein